MSRIFADNAPAYWAAGFQAIPLFPGQKRPAPTAWQIYHEKQVPDEVKQEWLSRHANGNLGLVLGQQSGVVMLDIDTDDPRVQEIITSLLPPSPWERYGRKGVMLAYKYDGERTFRIKAASGEMLVEVLSSRTQCVLPPSIHPDTQRPYTANCDLFDPRVISRLMTLPPGIEGILRSAMQAAGIDLSLSGHTKATDWVPKGARDVQMVAVAGMYANDILKGHKTFKSAMDEMVAWDAMRVERVVGDPLDITKGIRRLADFLISDVTGPKQRALPTGWDEGLTDVERTGFGFDVFNDDNEVWTLQRLKDYALNNFMATEPGTEARYECLNFIMSRLAHAGLNPREEETILRYVNQVGEFKLALTTLRRELSTVKNNGLKGDDETELANALIEDLGKEGELVYHGSTFWQWQGSHWAELSNDFLLKFVADRYGHLPAAKRQGNHMGVLRIAGPLVKREEGLATVPIKGVNFANCFLTTELVQLAHAPEYGCTYTLPYRYVPEEVGRAVEFERLLHTCWGEDPDFYDKKRALQEAIAVTLFGMGTTFQRVICLHGPGSTGKSQLTKIVEKLLPKHVSCSVPPDKWGERFMPAEFVGKLVNICGELPETDKISGNKFKEIVTGDSITVERKNRDPGKYRPLCTHWFATNHLPKTDDASSGFLRRWLILTYNKKISSEQEVLDLGELIAAEEREAIASWAVEVIPEVIKNKYTLPQSHHERLAEVARANNSVHTFLVDSGRVLIGALVTNSPQPVEEGDLYNAYFTFALEAGVAKPVKLPGFRQVMRDLSFDLGFQIKLNPNPTGGTTCWYENVTFAKQNVVSLRKSSGTR